MHIEKKLTGENAKCFVAYVAKYLLHNSHQLYVLQYEEGGTMLPLLVICMFMAGNS